ncbi:P-II family nitrogen regulator [Pontiella sp.]|uniref:P-II family nitrogen regulator n=1 Tax=Pontiella sp. TaxID=2837462 RepID=UPI0035698543
MSKLLVRSIVRPEKADEVMKSLLEAGYPAVTKVPVFGRGKQRGLKVGEVTYDELPKEMLMTVIPEEEKDFVIKTVLSAAKSSETGNFGDGKIFISPVVESYTISSGVKED